MSLDGNKAIALDMLQTFVKGNVAEAVAMTTSDFTWRVMQIEKVEGLPEVLKRDDLPAMADIAVSLFGRGNLKMHVKNIVAEGDQIVIQAEGEAARLAGGRYDNRYIFWITLRDGKVASVLEYFDTAYAKAALG